MTETNTSTATSTTVPYEPAWYERILTAIGSAWHWLVRMLFNLRRLLFVRRLPDYVVMTITGELLEREPHVPWYYDYLPMYATPLSIEYIRRVLQRVADEPNVRGIVFLFKGATLSLAQAESLAALFRRFHTWDHAQNSGGVNARAKRIVVYLEDMTGGGYAAAAAADYVVAPPLTEWDVKGLVVQPTYLKQTLARLGIEFDVVRVAPWKTAMDSLMHERMSAAEREQYEWLLDSLYGSLVDAIATGRKLPPEKVRELIECGAPIRCRRMCCGAVRRRGLRG